MCLHPRAKRLKPCTRNRHALLRWIATLSPRNLPAPPLQTRATSAPCDAHLQILQATRLCDPCRPVHAPRRQQQSSPRQRARAAPPPAHSCEPLWKGRPWCADDEPVPNSTSTWTRMGSTFLTDRSEVQRQCNDQAIRFPRCGRSTPLIRPSLVAVFAGHKQSRARWMELCNCARRRCRSGRPLVPHGGAQRLTARRLD